MKDSLKIHDFQNFPYKISIEYSNFPLENNDKKNGQSPRVRPTDGSDESLKLEIARIQKPMSLVR